MTTITKEQFDIAMRILNITSVYGLTDGVDADDKAFKLYTKFNSDINKMEERIEAIADNGESPQNDVEKYVESIVW